MARGNRIVVSANPGGKFGEGIVGSGLTFLPGMGVQVDYSVTTLIGGRHTYKYYDRAADGDRPIGPYTIVVENQYTGELASTTTGYTAGTRFFWYQPQTGDEINLLLADIAGTGDDHAVGELLMLDDGTGRWIATTGSPQSTPAALKEAVTDPTAATLAWCDWSGV